MEVDKLKLLPLRQLSILFGPLSLVIVVVDMGERVVVEGSRRLPFIP